MKKLILIVAAFLMGIGISYASPRYVGGDISLLPEYEEAGAKYKDHSGKPISDLLPFLREEVQTNFYNEMERLGIDYDIIGLSYYPYFHGSLSVLDKALKALEPFDKDMMIVETGYPYKWEVPGTTVNNTSTWPYSDAGQDKFVKDLVDELLKYPRVTGLFWWWMEYNAYGTSLSGWYNAPLFDSTTGKATAALKTLCSFADDSAVDGIYADPAESEAKVWYNVNGTRVGDTGAPGLYISRKNKKIVR